MPSEIGNQKTHPYLVRLKGLDVTRSMRMYEALANLSEAAVLALKNKEMKSFSIYTDKMRPLLSYINTNSVTLSEHLGKQNINFNPDTVLNSAELKDFVPKLRSNLKTIENARHAIASVPFQPAILASQEITDLFLDHFIPMAWDYEFDAIILVNLGDERLLDYLIERGQKRFILIASTVDESTLLDKLDKPGILFWAHKEVSIIRELFLGINGKPPNQFISIDCGEEKQNLVEKEFMLQKCFSNHQEQCGVFTAIMAVLGLWAI